MSVEIRARFEQYLHAVVERLSSDPRVVGLVAMGSTAERHRVDEWSDHDLAIVTKPGHQDELRRERGWVPDADRIVLDVVEWHGGGKVLFNDGRVIEFGVATVDELAGWAVHHHEVLLDRGGVAEAVERAVARSPRNAQADLTTTLELLIAHAHIGAGKAARGERLAASTSLRGDAVTYLLTALAITSPPDGRADYLDPRRRVEQTHPDVAAALSDAVRADERELARRLFDLTERLFGDRPEYPGAAIASVRARHGFPASYRDVANSGVAARSAAERRPDGAVG